MSYIGNTPQNQAFTPAVDYFNGTGSTTSFTLSRPVASVAQIQVVIENVPQNPSSAYTVSGNTITFTSAPPSGTNNIYVEYTSPITQVNALSQNPSVVGDLTTSGGHYAVGSFNSGYTDGIVMDYTSGLGRVTVGGSDALAFYYGGPSSRTESMRIDSSGNVGIGTSSPQAKLDLGGSTAGQTINFSNTGTNGTVRAAATFKYNTGSYAGGSKFLDVNLTGSFDDVYDIRAYTSNGGAAVERMRIDSSGNVLVGTDTAATSNTNSIWLQPSVGKGLFQHINGTATGTGYLAFIYNNSQIGSITQNGTTATAYNTSSDYRLKENIAPMTGALDTIAQLKPVTYKWKSTGEASQGFIAHELQEVVPDCVTGEKDAVDADGKPVYQGIDTSFLVATLTAAIQEQQALITSLTERIAVLEGK